MNVPDPHDVGADPVGARRLLDACEIVARDGWYIIRHPDGRRLSAPPTTFNHPHLGPTRVPAGMARRWRTRREAVAVVDAWRRLLNEALA